VLWWARIRAVLGIACLFGLTLAAPAGATFPGTNGRIAFSQGVIFPEGEPSSHSQIFTIEPSGGGLRQLTHVSKSQSAGLPDWSPDGTRIAFASNGSGEFGIWLMNADGSAQTRLTGRKGFGDFYPSWSPDGRRIVFSHCADPTGLGIFTQCDIDLMNADGSGNETLLSSGRWLNSHPQFSPNGKQVVFGSDRGGLQGAIWVMGADGSAPARLTKPRLRASWPDWSPSGDRILFADNCCVAHSNIYTVRPDGSGLKRITSVKPLSVNAAFPSYSPDGTRISLLFDKGCPEGPPFCKSFYTANADGSDFDRVLTGKPDTLVTDWGPEPVP
jgi:Tol biopolymer transport system component